MEEVIENDNRGEIIDKYSSSDNEVIQLSFHFFFKILLYVDCFPSVKFS